MSAERSEPIRFKWPVGVSHPIPTSSEAVWRIISAPGNLENTHPYCDRNPVERWPGENALDQVHYLNGWILERRFCRWMEGTGYDLRIGRPGGRVSFVSWRIAVETPAACRLTIVVCPHVLQDLPVPIRWLPHRLRVRPLLGQYLSAVVRGVEWYATTGKPVPRNQFGRHPCFS